MNMPFQLDLMKIRLVFSSQQAMHLSSFSGTMWRGAFGYGLKDAACHQPKFKCEDCHLKFQCLYPTLFKGQAFFNQHQQIVRPYIIEPDPQEQHLLIGDLFHVDLILLGNMQKKAGILIDAMKIACEHYGLGKKHQKATLVEVLVENQNDWQVYAPEYQHSMLQLPLPPKQFQLDFITPVRLKHQGTLMKPDQFLLSVFINNLQKRLIELQNQCNFHSITCPTPPKDVINNQHILSQSLSWKEQVRYSKPQHKILKNDGIIGSLLIDGKALLDYWPALWVGQWVHVGQLAAAGMGQYKIHISNQEISEFGKLAKLESFSSNELVY